MPQPLRVVDNAGTKVNRYYAPNHAQLSMTVKGKDPRHRIRVKRRPFWLIQFAYALMVLFILLLSFASLFIIGEVLR